jgi:hypothetical protein
MCRHYNSVAHPQAFRFVAALGAQEAFRMNRKCFEEATQATSYCADFRISVGFPLDPKGQNRATVRRYRRSADPLV